MPGFPVVIATNGIGVPVKPVLDRAPVMTIATNGFGLPIVISDLGAPFIVEGYSPPALRQALSADDGSNLLSDDDEPVETF